MKASELTTMLDRKMRQIVITGNRVGGVSPKWVVSSASDSDIGSEVNDAGSQVDDGTWHLRIVNSNSITDDDQNIFLDGVLVAHYTGNADFDNNFPISRPTVGDHVLTFVRLADRGFANFFQIDIVRESDGFIVFTTSVGGDQPSDYSPTDFTISS